MDEQRNSKQMHLAASNPHPRLFRESYSGVERELAATCHSDLSFQARISIPCGVRVRFYTLGRTKEIEASIKLLARSEARYSIIVLFYIYSSLA